MINLELSEQEVQVIGLALKQMPYHMVALLIEKIGSHVLEAKSQSQNNGNHK